MGANANALQDMGSEYSATILNESGRDTLDMRIYKDGFRTYRYPYNPA